MTSMRVCSVVCSVNVPHDIFLNVHAFRAEIKELKLQIREIYDNYYFVTACVH